MVDTGVYWLETRLVWGNQVVFNKKSEHFIKYESFKYFSTNWKQWGWSVIFQTLCFNFLMSWDYIVFFHSNRNEPVSMHWLIDFQIDLPQIFIMQILILSWAWALFVSKFGIISWVLLLERFSISKSFSVVQWML